MSGSSRVEAEEPAGRAAAGAVLVAGAALSLAVCGGLLLYGSGRGLDLTDEVFYLIWARDPHAYQLIYQPFGYLLHPLFRLVGGDLQAYRLAGFAIAAAAGAGLAASLPGAGRNRPAFLLYGAAAALTIFFPWIVTPSYNSAANLGAMLIVAGVLRTLDGGAWSRAAGAAAAGAGLCLAAFGKPPLFAIAVVVMALTARVRGARPALAGGLALGAVLISLVLAPPELVALVARMSASQHVLGMPNTPLALPMKVLSDGLIVPWPLTLAAIAAAGALALRRLSWSVWPGYAAVALSLGYIASVAEDAVESGIPDFLGLAIATAAAGYAGTVRGLKATEGFAAALLLLAGPAVALGTFNNQWFQLNFSMAFPFLALFALAAADGVRWRRRAARALAVAGPVAVMMLAALHPYSLPASIFDQQVRVAPPLANGVVRVDSETAAFVNGARGLARAAPLLVDLSGTGPGVGVVLGGKTPVLPWLNPAVPAWAEVVWSRLSPEARASAWFVAPVWPMFEGTAPAQWLAAHKGGFCRIALPPMTFWGRTRRLELWRPCAGARGGG